MRTFKTASGRYYSAETMEAAVAIIRRSIEWQHRVARQSTNPEQRKRCLDAANNLKADIETLAEEVDYVREKFVDRTADSHPLECMACNRRFADARALHQHLGASNRQHRKTHAWKMKGDADAGKDHISES